MKKTIISLLAAMLALTVVAAEKLTLNWEPDYRQAQEKAKKEKKPLFLFFTGSDWCPWCLRIDSEILSKPKLIRFANKNFILYKADFPRANKASAQVKADNNMLLKKFSVRGFPTIVITNPEGQKLGTLGYMSNGPDPFIKQLKKYTK